MERKILTVRGRSSYFWWRVITTLALLIAVGALAVVPLLYTRIDEAVKTNKESIEITQKVLCSFGDLIQLTPDGQRGRQQAIRGPHTHLEAELDFLTGIRDSHCPLIEKTPSVKTELQKTIELIEHHLKAHPEG
jgi:hypothetical protein